MQTIPANELLAGLTLAEPADIHAVVTDSRKVEPGCVFVCFPGERVDGHTFAAGAYRNGAAYIIANHPVDGVPEDRTVIVPDSARAMIRMASNYRMLFSPKMIGVTGSVGKTTTKEFCYAVLSAFGKAGSLSSVKNFVGRMVFIASPAPMNHVSPNHFMSRHSSAGSTGTSSITPATGFSLLGSIPSSASPASVIATRRSRPRGTEIRSPSGSASSWL